MNLKPIIEALQKAAFSYGAKAVSAELGFSAQYLGRICNPDPDPDEKRAMHLEHAMRIMEITGDTATLTLLASSLGFRLVPDAVAPNLPTVQAENCEDVQALGVFSRVVNDPMSTEADVRSSEYELHREISETAALKILEIRGKKP